jgi:hypothetical protein
LYLFIICVGIAVACGITLITIIAITGQTIWIIDFSYWMSPVETLFGVLGIVCAISGLLSAVFIIIYVVKAIRG